MKKKLSKLRNAKPEEYFLLVNGVPIKNVKELGSTLSIMNDWVFNHHVNESRNDFANWIEFSLKDEKLAKEIRGTKNIKEMELIIYRHLINNSI